MKKFLMQTPSGWSNESFDTYEEALTAGKLYAAKELKTAEIVRREILATVKPDIKTMPVIVEIGSPS